MKKWYSIQSSAQSGAPAKISIHDEIGAWGRMSDAERLRIMDEVLPRRSQGPHVG